MLKMLFHRHTPWQADIRCSTNIYAQLFLEDGAEVSYMQGLVHPGQVLLRRGQWQSWARGLREDRGARVFTPMSLIPFARRWPFNTAAAAHSSYKHCVPGVDVQLRSGGAGTPDIIWSAVPGSIALRSVFPRARFVFQVVDYYPAFSGSPVKAIEREDYHGADHVFVIGETLKQYIVADHGVDSRKVTVLGQGVFDASYRVKRDAPGDVADLPRPLGVWVGVLDKGDPQLFRAAALALGRIGGSLLLIGPGAPWVTELCREFGHVRAIGPRSPDQVPDYLLNADLALMLYDQARQAVYKGQNPLKLYEFAAAGLPIVSTPHDEYAFLDPPVLSVDRPDQVAAAIKRALEQREALRVRALEFASRHSWARAFEQARSQIRQLVPDARSAT